jgi:geranylgeranyl diphosphate synthase, type II
MVHCRPVATQPSPATGDLEALQRGVRERYAGLLLERLGLREPLRAVATHAIDGGKRIRPMLAELLGCALGASQASVTDVAIAIEYLHTASMILDDLPCMDNAAVRRGAPAAHVRYSEPEAILAAVALVSRSYAILLQTAVRDSRMLTLLATETVADTMARGQATESGPSVVLSLEEIERIHEQKTASLFALVGRLVAECAGTDDRARSKVVAFTTLLGRAYQIIDDVEDRDEPGEARANLARAVSVPAARLEAQQQLAEARQTIADIDESGRLGELVDWLARRVDEAD